MASALALDVHESRVAFARRFSSSRAGRQRIDQDRSRFDRQSSVLVIRPFEGKRRVVIIDDADALVLTAQNALLKTARRTTFASSVHFILVSARSDVLLPTVISRCPRLRFRPLGTSEYRLRADRARTRRGRDARAIAMILRRKPLAARSTWMPMKFSGAGRGATGFWRSPAPAGILAGESRWREDLADEYRWWACGRRPRAAIPRALRAMATLLRDTELIATGGDVGTLANADLRPASRRNSGRCIRASEVRGVFGNRSATGVAIERNAGVKIVADWLVLQL